MTKEQLIALCKQQNPVMIQTINGESRELNSAEYEEACENWALMRLEQIAKEQEEANLRALKISAYQKIGLSPEEIEALVPTPKT